MNFFEHQARARRDSTRLVVLFALAVVGIVLAVNLLVALVAGVQPRLLAVASIATVLVIGLGSMYRMASLRAGGDAVALQQGGVPLSMDASDPNSRRLLNIVEEVAIASGVPVPRVYVLEREAGINAFAAGYSSSDAVIAVTRGALDRLNRDELQGVVAHEFSHVLNGDMRLNIRLMGVMFGILMLGVAGRKVLSLGRFGTRRGSIGVPVLVGALVAMLIGYVGLFFGRLIKAGVSRSRERLADASAVQFTRQTSGLAGALKKIGGLDEGARLVDAGQAEEVSHMLFGDGVGYAGRTLGRWFATHPDLVERIQALEPGFTPGELERLQRHWAVAPPVGMDEDLQRGLAAPTHGPLPPAGSERSLTPPMVVAQVAHPGADDYRRADAIAAGIPEPLRRMATQRESVVPLVLGLLMEPGTEVAGRQRIEIAARMGEPLAGAADRVHRRHLVALHPVLRLPLAALAFPVLRLRPRPELERLMDTVQAMSLADGRVSLFEYCLGHLLTVQVRESLDPSRYARFGRARPHAVQREIATLLAVVAHAGHADLAGGRHAYLAGLHRMLPEAHVPYVPPAAGVTALDGVWEPLDRLDPLAKQQLVEAVTLAVLHDGRVSLAEAELLRTICAVLHCPLPPTLENV
ncbi:M48 family metallopeptidase [Lysobacter sp. A3-1-A15]|uniref:M48 family metallopeptidase n=1 Tax=Novilysobacter viscosus TaxID=3098602 RepID=UPI002ED89711